MNTERKSEVANKNKMKTHSGAKKRLFVTGTGKIRHFRSGHGHKLVHKSHARRRRLRKDTIINDVYAKEIRALIPYK
ncbi:MAG TPA: 50S ribosomal protein L35 [Bacillota bacterium]|nr:50S ribosomal protein L35 [Bacillota bacterium]